MSDDDQTNTRPERDEDSDLREALARQSVTTSDSHDSAVILAAQDAGREIRRRDAGTEQAATVWTRWSRPIAIAAALVLALYFVFDASLAPPPGPDYSVRGTASSDVVPQHRSTLRELPVQFEWPTQAGATGYRVTLRDADATPLWRTVSSVRNEALVPDDVRDRLDAGATYLWTVEVEGPAADNTLGPFWFEVSD